MTNEERKNLAVECVEIALIDKGSSIDYFTEIAKENAYEGAIAVLKALEELGYSIIRKQ